MSKKSGTRWPESLTDRKMPAGVSWGQYLRFSAAAFASMMVGAQCVHYYYKPLQDLDMYVEQELTKRMYLLNL